MTCIVGFADGTNVWMGGDSAGSSGYHVQTTANPKVFINQKLLIGYTGSFRVGQLLEYDLDVPSRPEGVTDLNYLVTKLIPGVRDCLRSGGAATTNNGEESGGQFLLGYRGKLYQVDTDYQVFEPANQVASVGCGYPYALGAMYANAPAGPEDRIKSALEIAERCSGYVRGPFTILKL